MKVKMIVMEMEADTVGATDELCETLRTVLATVFPHQAGAEAATEEPRAHG